MPVSSDQLSNHVGSRLYTVQQRNTVSEQPIEALGSNIAVLGQHMRYMHTWYVQVITMHASCILAGV